MSLPRFFLEKQVISNEQDEIFPLDLAEDDLNHAKVLRLKAGEHIAVIDASADYFELEIVDACVSPIMCRIASRGETRVNIPEIALFHGIPKGDKLDTVVRQATEIGVSGFIPFECERSVVKLDGKKAEKRKSRLQAIAKSAAMQAGREKVPEVAGVSTFSEAQEMLGRFDVAIIFWEEAGSDAAIRDFIHGECGESRNFAIVVGPEGGFTETEVEKLASAARKSLVATMGDNILRTETAGLIGPAIAIYELGGLGRLNSQ